MPHESSPVQHVELTVCPVPKHGVGFIHQQLRLRGHLLDFQPGVGVFNLVGCSVEGQAKPEEEALRRGHGLPAPPLSAPPADGPKEPTHAQVDGSEHLKPPSWKGSATTPCAQLEATTVAFEARAGLQRVAVQPQQLQVLVVWAAERESKPASLQELVSETLGALACRPPPPRRDAERRRAAAGHP